MDLCRNNRAGNPGPLFSFSLGSLLHDASAPRCGGCRPREVFPKRCGHLDGKAVVPIEPRTRAGVRGVEGGGAGGSGGGRRGVGLAVGAGGGGRGDLVGSKWTSRSPI